MSTIIIPYRSEVHAGLELLYAIRSIEKNLKGWSAIFIIGKPPSWYVGKSIPAEDLPGRKQFNIYSKILLACNTLEVSENFVLWNDDHILLKPLNVSAIKYWHNGKLKDQLTKPSSSRELNALKETIKMVGDGVHYDIHTPIIYNKQVFKELFEGKTGEFIIKSYYANKAGVKGEFMKDPKGKGDLFFSTNTTIPWETVELLKNLFPVRSKYEK